MNSRAKFLRTLVPLALKQLLLRLRLRWQGGVVEFGPGARFDTCCRFAPHVALGAGASVFGSRVGRWTYFGDHSLSIYTDIGSFCSIAAHAVIGGGKHPTRDYVTTSPIFYSGRDNPWGSFEGSMEIGSELPKTHIGNDVWIGHSAVILPGITVGHGAIVGAGAVVTRNVGPYEIVAGVPARVMRSRFDPDGVAWLLSVAWWEWSDERLLELRPKFGNIEALRAAVEASASPVPAGRGP